MICGYLRMYVHHSSINLSSTVLGKNNDAHKVMINNETILSYAFTFLSKTDMLSISAYITYDFSVS